MSWSLRASRCVDELNATRSPISALGIIPIQDVLAHYSRSLMKKEGSSGQTNSPEHVVLRSQDRGGPAKMRSCHSTILGGEVHLSGETARIISVTMIVPIISGMICGATSMKRDANDVFRLKVA